MKAADYLRKLAILKARAFKGTDEVRHKWVLCYDAVVKALEYCLTASRPRVDHGSTMGRPLVVHGSTTGRPGVDHGERFVLRPLHLRSRPAQIEKCQQLCELMFAIKWLAINHLNRS